MKNIPEILSNTILSKDKNTTVLFNKIVSHTFYNAPTKAEAEMAILLAHKYKLRCLKGMLNMWNNIPGKQKYAMTSAPGGIASGCMGGDQSKQPKIKKHSKETVRGMARNAAEKYEEPACLHTGPKRIITRHSTKESAFS